MFGLFVVHGEILFDTCNAAEVHVLSNLYGIGAPRGNHFASGADKPAGKRVVLFGCGVSVEPAKFIHFGLAEWVIDLCGNHALLRCSKKQYHRVVFGVSGFRCKVNGIFGLKS